MPKASTDLLYSSDMTPKPAQSPSSTSPKLDALAHYIDEIIDTNPHGGRKNDQGKPRMDLIPADFELALGALYAMGAAKYEDRNWQRGMDWGRTYAAAKRHINKWWLGEQYDPVDGQHHLVAAVWNCIALWWFEQHNVGNDTRHNPEPKP